MAYQLTSIVDKFGTTHSGAYLRITSVEVRHHIEAAVVSYEIYESASSASSGSYQPLQTGVATFTGDTYSSTFGSSLGTDPLGTQPTNVNDIVQCQAYLAMKSDSECESLLSGATAV